MCDLTKVSEACFLCNDAPYAIGPSRGKSRVGSAAATEFRKRDVVAPILEDDLDRHPYRHFFWGAPNNIGHHLRSLFQSNQGDDVWDLIGESGRYRASHNRE